MPGTKRKAPEAPVVIEPFDPSTAKPDAIWLIIAPRRAGKTFLMFDILSKICDKFDFVMLMTKSKATAEMFKGIIPDHLIYKNGYDYEIATRFQQICEEIRESGKKRYALLILDDCMYDKGVMKSETQQDLHLNGRQYNSGVMNTTQYMKNSPPAIRTNIDYAVALWDPSEINQEEIRKAFFSVLGNAPRFRKIFRSATRDRQAIILDRTDGEAKVFYYKASAVEKPFTLGRKIHFKLSNIFHGLNQEAKSGSLKKRQKTSHNLQDIVIPQD